jgi:NAD(P)-dependent dehydrogenase (short-subunit alcohol dehydrogenase family)
VSQEDSFRAVIETAVRHYGGLHILHNNAFVEASIEEFWRAIRLDLFGTFLGCRFGIPAIIASGGGSVINMASSVALMGVAGLDCYTAAKGGIAAITRSMAVEFAPKVRVNAIAPAATDRPCARAVRGRQSPSDEDRRSPPDRADRAGGNRQHGCVPGVRRIPDGHWSRVSGG